MSRGMLIYTYIVCMYGCMYCVPTYVYTYVGINRCLLCLSAKHDQLSRNDIKIYIVYMYNYHVCCPDSYENRFEPKLLNPFALVEQINRLLFFLVP